MIQSLNLARRQETLDKTACQLQATCPVQASLELFQKRRTTLQSCMANGDGILRLLVGREVLPGVAQQFNEYCKGTEQCLGDFTLPRTVL